jgi:hypothetical protein
LTDRLVEQLPANIGAYAVDTRSATTISNRTIRILKKWTHNGSTTRPTAQASLYEISMHCKEQSAGQELTSVLSEWVQTS